MFVYGVTVLCKSVMSLRAFSTIVLVGGVRLHMSLSEAVVAEMELLYSAFGTRLLPLMSGHCSVISTTQRASVSLYTSGSE